VKILTFTIPKGGVGKTLLQANVAVALAGSGKRVIVFDADPSKAMETIMGVTTGPANLVQVISKNQNINDAVYETKVKNLYLLPSGLGLEAYLDLGSVKLARKLEDLDCDILMVDVAFPMGEAAFVALGICHYLFMILSEDEFSLCVEGGIDLARLARHVFSCKPAGFIVNRITGDKVTDKLVSLVEKAFEAPCIARIKEDPSVRKSYGGPHKRDAYLFYQRNPDSEFAANVRVIADFISGLPEGKKKSLDVLENVMKQVKRS
jgi:MinD-like ATPase involved in chromosome partitioning or flagellar assembly